MLYLTLLLAAFASAVTITPEVTQSFAQFAEKYGKTYSADEYAKRVTIFAQNLERAKALNKGQDMLGGESVHGITKFMDLTPEEFSAIYLNYIPHDEPRESITYSNATDADVVDWRTKGVLTAVKDQGQCGSCWAFSATEAIESYAKLSGKYGLIELSPQQINSCDTVDGGCNGGNTETAYKYVQDAGGLVTESDFPYTSGTTGRTGECTFDESQVKVSINGFTSVSQGEDNLKSALNDGPVSVCVAANAFQTYSGGVLKYCPGQIDHCVQAVGYDTTGDQSYWIIRNSWAESWGEDGFIRVIMGKDACKVADDVTFPTFV